MTVKELIEELQKVEEHKEVYVFVEVKEAKVIGVIDSHLSVILSTKKV